MPLYGIIKILCKKLWFVRSGVWLYVLGYCPFTVYCDLLYLFIDFGYPFGERDWSLLLMIVYFVVCVSVVIVVVTGGGVLLPKLSMWLDWRDALVVLLPSEMVRIQRCLETSFVSKYGPAVNAMFELLHNVHDVSCCCWWFYCAQLAYSCVGINTVTNLVAFSAAFAKTLATRPWRKRWLFWMQVKKPTCFSHVGHG